VTPASTLPLETFAGTLRGDGITIRVGPFLTRVRSSFGHLAAGLHLLYGDNPVDPDPPFSDFHVTIAGAGGIRRWYRPQARFLFNGHMPFRPLPLDQALALFEWGLNWCISFHAHQYLIIHSAAIAKDGRAVLLPAPPGSGKSTLCAALVHRGWRLLSDELALIDLETLQVIPLARPVNLKNQSIDIIGKFAKDSVFAPLARDTLKGTIGLMKAPAYSVAHMDEPAQVDWIIFPKYKAGAAMHLADRSKAKTALEVGQNAFNYSIHGARGFDTLTRLVDRCACYDFVYQDLDDAIEVFASLAR